MSTIETCKEAYAIAPMINSSTLSLEYVLCIYHLVWFKKDQVKVQALIDSNNEINAMTLAYAAKLGFKICLSNVGVQMIDGSTFETFEIVLASF